MTDSCQSFKVRVHCATYNHVNYITDALDGFVSQKTDFPYVCTIVDDASTDGEQVVIKKYLLDYFEMQDTSVTYEIAMDYGQVTYAQHKVNRNCYFAVIFLKENHFRQKKSKDSYLSKWMNTKYIAFCEGDDYWIDSLKLQKQVDFLETHEECSMCFHSAKILNEAGLPVGLDCQELGNRYYSATDLFEKWIVPTASIVCRRESLLFPIKNPGNILNGDIFLVEKCAHSGKVYAMKEIMSVYRIQQHGVTYDDSLKEERIRRYPAHYKEIRKNFPLIKRRIVNKNIAFSYFGRGSCEKRFVKKYCDYFVGTVYSPISMMMKLSRFINKKMGRV